MNYEYASNIKMDTTALPPVSIEALLKRGANHVFGNEVASKVTTAKKKHAADNNGAELSDDEVAALTDQFRADALARLLAGTIGTATRGPAVDPVEAEMERAAWAEIQVILKANGSKSEGKGEDRVWKFANGASFSKDQLIERRLSGEAPSGVDAKTGVSHADRLRKDAEKALKVKAKQAAAAKEAAQGVEL